jgi:citrate synthase
MKQFDTEISVVTPGLVNIRGRSLERMMTELSFVQAAMFMIIGRVPTADEQRLIEAMLIGTIDHGFVSTTTTAARYIASGNPQLVPAVAGGLLAAGSNTLSPAASYALLDRIKALIPEAGETEAVRRTVSEYLAAGLRLPGFGHPTHKDGDFRAKVLLEVAAGLDVPHDSVRLVTLVHAELASQRGGRELPLNVDGALAAICQDLGFTLDQAVAIALLSVLPGLMGQVIEELAQDVPLRYAENVTYSGPNLRD